ncbi:putative nucleic-acid-binding protein [Roseiarcus fermentans]|uniref:Putative nucleic-acid-binding protein n=1 Tax=Roseiarcus fermentans TaxID=1473586 RepID=A0A366FIP3_9HYPH|nr:type II toxin-antitoxin system VapC family toxin [Roseiarcus fermentans]RBP13850.1 putative nucleic-acid-binding protein [Roseiarcus fermentans]
MIGLDTNVLLRLFIDDDREQCGRARSFVEQAGRGGPCMVNVIVLAEFAWVLGKSLDKPKVEVIKYLDGVLQSDDLEFERRTAVVSALEAYRNGPAEFADYLLAQINVELGCASTATFDAKALKSSQFSLVP